MKREPSAAMKEFAERARGVTVAEAAARLKLAFLRGKAEHPQPCPVGGGKDGFSFNEKKNKWNCRKCGEGGRDAIGMAAHVLGLGLSDRAGFAAACEAVLGEAAPDPDARETDEERAARQDRIARRQAENEAAAAERERANEAFRERERAKARGKWLNAGPARGTPVEVYLTRRSGHGPLPPFARFIDGETYFDGEGVGGRPREIGCGPAMVMPFVAPDGTIIGCHITWIDLANPPKWRPDFGLDAKGKPRATKKMRGSKEGGLIPLHGFCAVPDADAPGGLRILPDSARFRAVGGEGIETTRAVAISPAERRADTLYFAAGDLGNLAGPADPDFAFDHPELTFTDAAGRARAVRVPGPSPRPDQMPGDALQLPETVSEAVLLADGDSERMWTASTMARARARLSQRADGTRRLLAVAWPPAGMDFADMLAIGREGGDDD